MTRHRAGQLDKRLTLQAWDGTKTEAGAPVYTDVHWTDQAQLWAKVVPLAGTDVERARKLVPEATVQIEVRAYTTETHRPRPGKRFRHRDGRTWYVAAVLDEMEAGSKLICLCGTQPID